MATCVQCGTEFTPPSKRRHKYCSDTCRGKAKYARERESRPKSYYTSRNYNYISGHWGRYFQKLLNSTKQRHDAEIIQISSEDLIEKLKQQSYRCALSGTPLTCRLASGVKFHTNASIDRIDPGGLYHPDNVHLVCSALNSFRQDINLEEFIGWCVAVAENHYRS